jgi:hypothetical protein
MEFAVDPLVAAAVEDLESGSINVVIPAPPNTVFTYSDEHGTVSWLPHPTTGSRLTGSLRNDLTAAVGQSPRPWLSLFRLKTVNCLTNRSTPCSLARLFTRCRVLWRQGAGDDTQYERIIGASTMALIRQEMAASRQRRWREIRITPRRLSVLGNANSQLTSKYADNCAPLVPSASTVRRNLM